MVGITPTTNSISQYYLKIQALTPAANNSSSSTTTTATPANTTTPLDPKLALYIFIGMLFVGVLALLITKTRQLNKLIVVLFISFITSAIPLGLNLTQQKAQLSSQAGPELIPTQVVVTTPTPSEFELSWHTDKPQVGVVKLSTSPDMKLNLRIISETIDIPVPEHHLLIDGLEPKTTYFIQILSGSTWYDDHGQPLMITTTR